MRNTLAALSVTLLVIAPGAILSAEVDYAADIKPLLMEKCAACHGALKQEAGLRLDASQLIRRGSEEGAVVVSGNANESTLLQRVSARDSAERMPPEGEGEPLDDEQIELLRRWISAGTPAPDKEPVPAGPQDHWAYQIPARPPIPTSGLSGSATHPIDAFLRTTQETAGVEVFPPADRTTVLRRVTFDLIGLPPTPSELHAFLQDDSDEAYERVVDRLLTSPRHGERWARHWMDVWRYSDWDGYKNELRGSQRHIWRWRDWIVESLNADKGYDQIVREMLCGR